MHLFDPAVLISNTAAIFKMSKQQAGRFWGAEDSSSESGSSSESEVKPVGAAAAAAGGAGRPKWETDSEEEEERRDAPRSAQERALEAIWKPVCQIYNVLKNNDWTSLSDGEQTGMTGRQQGMHFWV